MSAEEKNDSTAADSAAATGEKPAKKVAATKKKRGRPSKAELAARAAGAPAPSSEAPQPTASVQQQESAPAPTGTESAPAPTGTTGVSPVADAQQRVSPAAPAPAQPTVSPPGEQPMSNRQRRRMEWLARAAQRNGNRPGFKGAGRHGQMQPQGNRRLPSEVPQNLPPPLPAVPRNPDLPEYNLQDIHSWENG